MKKAGKAISWTIRIAILLALAYFLRPLYWPGKPTLPASRGAGDSVTWTFHSDTNALVTQALTICGDGRSVVLVKRVVGDTDLPEFNSKWKISRDKASGLSRFKLEPAMPADKAKQMLDAALNAGVLDLQSEPPPGFESLEIQTSFGGSQRSATGPQFVSQPVDLNPNVWINRLRWQKIANLIEDDAELRSLLAKKKVTLVDDDGKEVKPAL